jgi:hypothetical protein
MIRLSTSLLLPFFLLIALLPATSRAQEAVDLFNGKDLTGWDGDPALWKVVDGIITGTCTGPGKPEHNDFLIWRGDARRGGTLKDFELTVTMRVVGDNNSGIQYRSRPLPEVGPWAIAGYQCDVHPAIEHTGMTYEEKGRGIFGLNGKNVVLGPDAQRWLVGEQEPVKVDVSQWQTYTVFAKGNVMEHRINGQLTSKLIDCDEKGRALEGLLAFQLHSGNANTVEIREVKLNVLEVGDIVPFILPANAIRIDKPTTSRPQGLGKPAAANPAAGKKP